jgi:cell wall-associated NlpC family hydrolase
MYLLPRVRRELVVLLTLAAAAWSAACASTGATPRPFPTPGGAPPAASSDSRSGSPAKAPGIDSYALVGTALALRGAPYRNGGADPKGFDCSGFTQYVYAQYGLALPRSVRDQYQIGQSVSPKDLAPGDLVFFTTTDPGASHVAIAVGGDEFVHAPSSTGVVRVEHLSSSYWGPRVVGARRVAP